MSDNTCMKYTIRLVDTTKTEWLEVITRLQKRCLPSDTLYAPLIGWWHIVFDERMEPVAFSGLVPSLRWTDTVYLCRAGVLKEHRGRGIQKRLIKARLKKAKALGMNWAITDTYNNPASANSIIACGFQCFDPTVPWGDTGTIHWRCKISHAL